MKPSEMASSSNSRWQNCKERPNNGDMVERAKRPVNEFVNLHLIREKLLLSIFKLFVHSVGVGEYI